MQGELVESVSGSRYPIVNFIPRFIPLENYASNFDLEWNMHSRTQFDETFGFSLSRERFEKETGWGPDLRGENILEVGSGSGRFTRHAIDTGALVFSCDISGAVEANYRSNGTRENLLLVPDAYDATLRKWAFLDTFDMLSPMYGKPATLRTFRQWHEQAGLVDIDVHYGFNGLEGRGTKAGGESAGVTAGSPIP